MPVRRAVPATLAALVLTAAPALAAWPNLPTTNLPVCTATNTQAYPTIAGDGAGGAIVTWQDSRGSLGTDIYAQHVLASGTVDPAWPVNGQAICTAPSLQLNPTIVADGAGGAVITWQDDRSGTTYDIYAQHVLASGTVDPAWPVNGLGVCTAAGNQAVPTIVTDGAGGAIIAWDDFRNGANYDIYAQHVLVSGTVDPAWPVNGQSLCTAAGNQYYPTIVADGSGGAIVTWYDYRGANADIYAQHVLAAGLVDPAWAVNGSPICTTTGDQVYPQIASDGAGGAIVTWYDFRSGTSYDVYAQHVLASGAPDGAWPFNGQAVCTVGSNTFNPVIVSDAAGGALVAWSDNRSGTHIYAQHVPAAGGVDAAWPVNGLPVCTAANSQVTPAIVPDGTGGAIVCWQDLRSSSSSHIYTQHVLATGSVDYTWPYNGRATCTATNYQNEQTLVSDGAGGAIVCWADFRSGVYTHIYAQRVEAFGRLGNPEPMLASVRDVPNDQGGHVKASWNASYLDAPPYDEIFTYEVWRSIPPAAAAAALRAGARLERAGEPAPVGPGRGIRYTTLDGVTYAWEYVGSEPARRFASYSYDVPTTGDSVAGSNPLTEVLVIARDADNYSQWLSLPVGGYSVDNLPPVSPGPFAGSFSAGTTTLHWGENLEKDLAGYRLYRGATTGFTPGPASLIASPIDTAYTDAAGRPYVYKLSAMDIHGNESGFTTLTPSQMSGVGAGSPALAFAAPAPNPATTSAAFRFSLSRDGAAKLAVYDAAGRFVRVLADGETTAGAHGAAWDLRDASGRNAGAGLYFARLEAEGRTLVRRIAVTP